MTQNGHLLELVDVNQIYTSGRRQFTAIENVNLTLDEGEFVALLGPSGCGKSTLLRIITGLQRPTTGRVLYRGRELQDVNPWATIVFQTFALFPWLTVERNVLVALDARGVPADEARPKALALLDKVGLDGFETAYPRELSGGMRQKVGFARAMAVEPELLCLDEPFSALDVLSAESLRGELLELWTSGAIPTKAILMVTHSIEEAVFMADRIVVMDKEPGRVVASIRVDLPHPRQRKDGRFLSLVDRVYGILAGQTQPEQVELGTAPGELGPKRILPDVDVNELAGLLELLNDRPAHRADIYQLVDELRIDSDRLLRLTETAELLGFAAISQGDILLTPLGEAFAEASILARKEIFATRIRRLPLFRWLMNMLRAAENGRLNASVVQTALEFDLSSEDARRQIDTAIDWGRYAEILAYDDDTQTIYREMIAA
ncbi:MAG: nitrate/sulfonate/bicarbonate ABC transporter ATP-binding protein [Anaerolineae bacterium]|jgi:NitT/TauT family transport system ATP-binding protein